MPFVLHEDASVWSWFSGGFFALIRKCCFSTKLKQTVVAFDFMALPFFFTHLILLSKKRETIQTLWKNGLASFERGRLIFKRTGFEEKSGFCVSRASRARTRTCWWRLFFFFIESCHEASGLVAEVKFAAHADQ